MKKFIAVALVAFFLSSCIKSAIDKITNNTNNNTSPDYTLYFYDADTSLLYTQNFLNIPNAAYAAGSYEIKSMSIQLNIGNKETMPNNWQNKLYCTIDFFGTNNPRNIIGIYEFPKSNNLVKLKFKNDMDFRNDFISRQMPDSGQLIVRYDTVSKKISGEFKKILFAKPQLGPNVFDALNGTFKHMPIKN